MDNFDYPAIGQRIKQLRKRKGLNQTELAQMLKKSLRTVQTVSYTHLLASPSPSKNPQILRWMAERIFKILSACGRQR